MGRIPDDVIERIRNATDVVEVLSRHMALRKKGRSHGGLCPFHQEKTPSFNVWTESGVWRCFGCGKGGNVFTFLQEKEGLSFPEAVRQCARAAGIALPEDDDPEAARAAARLEHLRNVTEWACRHFQAMLREPSGATGRDYYKRRGILGTTARDFRLGWAPPGWDHLLVAGRRDGWSEQDLLDAGLVISREGKQGVYDRFRDRVVFPIADAQGRVIAFGARTLGDDQPKYLNSPETPLYTKGKHLYAFHLARGEMLRTGEGAVMEGYTDVILAHQAGYRVAVAGLGTALTPDQARRLAQYAKKLWLVYDGDSAGLKAAERAIPAFLPEPIETRVCVLPGEKDPADVFVEDGADAFRASLSQSREAFDHLIHARSAANDVSTVPGKSAAIDECLTALVHVGDEMRRALYVKRLADEFGVPEDVVQRRLRDLRLRTRSDEEPPARAAPGRASAPGAGAPSGDPDHADGSPWVVPAGETVDDGVRDGRAPAGVSETVAPVAPPDPARMPVPPAERQLVEAFLGAPALVEEAPPWILEAMTHPWTRQLAAALLEARDAAGAAPDADRIVGGISDPTLASFAVEVREGGHGKRLTEQGRDCLRRLAQLHEERRLREELHGTDSAAEEDDLLRRLQKLHADRARRPAAPGAGPATGPATRPR